MIDMSTIPNRQKHIYQNCKNCSLDCSALPGIPAFGGACIRIIPEAAAQLGSPHQYCEPGSDANHLVQKVFPRDEQESNTV